MKISNEINECSQFLMSNMCEMPFCLMGDGGNWKIVVDTVVGRWLKWLMSLRISTRFTVGFDSEVVELCCVVKGEILFVVVSGVLLLVLLEKVEGKGKKEKLFLTVNLPDDASFSSGSQPFLGQKKTSSNQKKLEYFAVYRQVLSEYFDNTLVVFELSNSLLVIHLVCVV
jgi:hypothetical protein